MGGILGLCIGDALGFPFEGVPRNSMDISPAGKIADMPDPGLWSDDSSLTLCLAQSLTTGFDLDDIASKFMMWLYEGYMTPQGRAFGIGKTTHISINNLKKGISPLNSGLKDAYSNGNGSLMRILPLAYYTANLERCKRFDLTAKVSAITHAHPRSVLACCMYVQMAVHLLQKKDCKKAYADMQKAIKTHFKGHSQLAHFSRILHGNIGDLERKDIRSGGYVVDTLEASLWCLVSTSDYKDAIIKAIGLGYDTDTTAAVAGGLAGTCYGLSAIPKKWINGLAKNDAIITTAEEFYQSLR